MNLLSNYSSKLEKPFPENMKRGELGNYLPYILYLSSGKLGYLGQLQIKKEKVECRFRQGIPHFPLHYKILKSY